MARWTAFPYDSSAYTYDPAALKRKWADLHAGDAERPAAPPPTTMMRGSAIAFSPTQPRNGASIA